MTRHTSLIVILLGLTACGGGGGGTPAAPTLQLMSGNMVFLTRQGVAPASQTVTATIRGQAATGITASVNAAWLSATPGAGNLSVAVDPATLASGVHHATVTVQASGLSQSLPVTLVLGDVVARIDTIGNSGLIPTLALGANASWDDLGAGILHGGELLRDRSFRLQGTGQAVWAEVPNGGTVQHLTGGGDGVAGGYLGCMRLDRGAAGDSLIWQQPLRPLAAGEAASLRFSVYGDSVAASATMRAFLVNDAWAVVSNVVEIPPATGSWSICTGTLTASGAATGLVLDLHQTGAGTSSVRVDEARLWTTPTMDPVATARIGLLGLRTMRWPGGTHVDTFSWRSAVGAMADRGEVATDLGHLQTPSFGLHEFLDLCQTIGAEPLLQVNIRDGAAEAAALWRYVNGAAGSVEADLRISNGHPAAWGVRRWDLGNEPNEIYDQGSGAAAGYAAQAGSAADALHALDATAILAAAGEGGFTLADWLPAAPLLQGWNGTVFAGGGPLAGRHQAVGAHCYSYHSYHADAATRWRYRASAGTIQHLNLATLAGVAGTPAWLTEHGSVLENPPGTVAVAYIRDAGSGVVMADQLLSAWQDRLQVLCLHNLAQAVGFGALIRRADGSWGERPVGLALRLGNPFPGCTLLPCTVEGATTISLGAGAGHVPTGTIYPEVALLAVRNDSGGLHLLAINRSWSNHIRIALDLGAVGANSGLTRLEPADLDVDNEASDAVVLSSGNTSGSDALLLDLPPHSVQRVDLSGLIMAGDNAPPAPPAPPFAPD